MDGGALKLILNFRYVGVNFDMSLMWQSARLTYRGARRGCASVSLLMHATLFASTLLELSDSVSYSVQNVIYLGQFFVFG